MSQLQVRVVSPDSVLHDGPAASVVAPAWDGKIGILPGHAPMIALVGSGELSIDRAGGGSEALFVAGGVLKVEGDDLMILVEYGGAEAPEELPAGAKVDVGEILEAIQST
ncbi:MAG: F0F1 ATP synthase subunit epsilon [Gemmatimonadetes bacterium]|nr:F0F1 ATP synthase subunit epsilon [Gemmatimonadota bacterium]